jgi:hypothetical protein
MRNDRNVRGAPRPLPDHLVVPDERLPKETRQYFDEAVRTRPGFWCANDIPLLVSYARALYRLKQAERDCDIDPSAHTPATIQRLQRMVTDLASQLRLTPKTRAENMARVQPPLAADDVVSRGVSATKDITAAAPWRAGAKAN